MNKPSQEALAAARQLNVNGLPDEHIAAVIDHHFGALREDKARLDWIQSRYASAVFNPHMNFYQIADTITHNNLAAEVELRSAIDAARKG